jgi:hypothetical protein
MPRQCKTLCSGFQALNCPVDNVVADIGNAEALQVLVQEEVWCYADFAREVRLFGKVGGVGGVVLGQSRLRWFIDAAVYFAVTTLAGSVVGINPWFGIDWGLSAVGFGVEK